ncbi:chemotaxis protein CheB [Colwellia psychrerythraea]|uniref:protein-glutamate methylesterase n=1 Tax=Colwellia psychrerythraea TaxID=28229 RepID=A0A099KWB8_COLPS|nr:chemotaxis protein CheB [Colwellia psychrerythraea]KGJ93948.1 CheB methylesterase [Colwellia psychrerythraea]
MTGSFKHYVFIGGSAGSLAPITQILSNLPDNFYLPITMVIHRSTQSDASLIDHFSDLSKLKVIEVVDKQIITARTIFISPCEYHLQVENDHAFSLCLDGKIHFCRPAIDILFTTAAEVFGKKCIAILCSGSNVDGVSGLLKIKQLGGTTIVQSPQTAKVTVMPKSAIMRGAADMILSPEEILTYLLGLH